MPEVKQVTAFGKTQTVREWSRETGLTTHLIHIRLCKGWSPEDALSRPKRAAADKPKQDYQVVSTQITARGKTMSAREWSEETGVPAQTILNRVRRGWDPELAVVVLHRMRLKSALIPPGQPGSISWSILSWDEDVWAQKMVAMRGAMRLEEIGELMDLTRERVRQLEMSALKKLRRAGLSMQALREFAEVW